MMWASQPGLPVCVLPLNPSKEQEQASSRDTVLSE